MKKFESDPVEVNKSEAVEVSEPKSVEEKTNEASEKISGFKDWIKEQIGSRIFSRMQNKINRDVVAIDFNSEDKTAAMVLKEKGDNMPQKEINSGVEVDTLYSNIGLWEAKAYRPRKKRSNREELGMDLDQERELNKFLSSVTDIQISLEKYISNPYQSDCISFKISGKDPEGKILTKTFHVAEPWSGNE